MDDIKRKLTSRKFWAAVAEFVTMLILAFHGTQETATQVAALIMAGAAVVAYIIGEGLADAAGAGQPFTYVDAEHVSVDTNSADVSIDKADVSKGYVDKVQP